MTCHQLIYSDRTSVQLCENEPVSIQTGEETVLLSELDQPRFDNQQGEVVVEFTGLSCDGRRDRSVAKAQYSAGGSSKLHYHREHREFYYVTEGRAEVTLNDRQYRLEKGDTLEVGPGVYHQVENISPKNGRLTLIVKCVPAWTADDLHFVSSHI